MDFFYRGFWVKKSFLLFFCGIEKCKYFYKTELIMILYEEVIITVFCVPQCNKKITQRAAEGNTKLLYLMFF